MKFMFCELLFSLAKLSRNIIQSHLITVAVCIMGKVLFIIPPLTEIWPSEVKSGVSRYGISLLLHSSSQSTNDYIFACTCFVAAVMDDSVVLKWHYTDLWKSENMFNFFPRATTKLTEYPSLTPHSFSGCTDRNRLRHSGYSRDYWRYVHWIPHSEGHED